MLAAGDRDGTRADRTPIHLDRAVTRQANHARRAIRRGDNHRERPLRHGPLHAEPAQARFESAFGSAESAEHRLERPGGAERCGDL